MRNGQQASLRRLAGPFAIFASVCGELVARGLVKCASKGMPGRSQAILEAQGGPTKYERPQKDELGPIKGCFSFFGSATGYFLPISGPQRIFRKFGSYTVLN